jgi:hypothetical protein
MEGIYNKEKDNILCLNESLNKSKDWRELQLIYLISMEVAKIVLTAYAARYSPQLFSKVR